MSIVFKPRATMIMHGTDNLLTLTAIVADSEPSGTCNECLLSLLPGQGCRLLSLQLLHSLHKATLPLLLPLAALFQICIALLQSCCCITQPGLCLMLPVPVLLADCSGLLAVSYDCR